MGERLALCALANHYGESIVAYSGPTLLSVDRLPGSIRLHFAHADGGLVVKGEKLEEFSIAGDDRKWYWADARIEGDTIVLSSSSVPNPKEVRYAWQSNPAATLFNGSWLTRRSLPHGYLARHYGGTQTVLRKRKPRESINLTTNSRSPSAPAPRSSPPYRRDSV